MKARFEGEDGRRRLLDLLMEQRAIGHDSAIAALIADAAELRNYAAGEVLIRQDDDSFDVAFLLIGSVDIVVKGQRVASRSAGQHVGEMTAIDPKAKRSATVCAREATVAAWVPEAKFSAIAKDHSSLWRGFARELADRLRERGNLLRVPNPKPRVFVGSSVEGIVIARLVQKALHHDPMLVCVWDNNTFSASSYATNDLLAEAAKSDFAIFVVRGDDVTQSRDMEAASPRDNVIFELGLFMGALGRERTFLLRPRGNNLKIPSDLFGLTALAYDDTVAPDDLDAALGPACSEFRAKVKRLGPR